MAQQMSQLDKNRIGHHPGLNFEKSICQLKDKDVVVKPKHGSYPEDYERRFKNLGLPSPILENIRGLGYKKLTPIQAAAWKVIMGKDNPHVLASSPTGDGKTLALLLPIIAYFYEANKKYGDAIDKSMKAVQPYAVWLTNTHEQVEQIYECASALCHGTDIVLGQIYGGKRTPLPAKTHILVCTFGKLVHFWQEGLVSLDAVEIFVMDQFDLLMATCDTNKIKGWSLSETDKFIQQFIGMNIEEQTKKTSKAKQKRPSIKLQHLVQYMLQKVPDVQLIMATATQQDIFRQVMEDFHLAKTPVQIMIKCQTFAANVDIVQYIEKVEHGEKMKKLVEILDIEMNRMDANEDNNKWMVFVRGAKAGERMIQSLSNVCPNMKAVGFNSVMQQKKREVALAAFMNGESPIMVTTRLAGRGLEIPGQVHVIQHDLPDLNDKSEFQAEYVNRIGRTGRIGNVGKATAFYDPARDRKSAQWILDVLAQTQQNVPDWLLQGAGCQSL